MNSQDFMNAKIRLEHRRFMFYGDSTLQNSVLCTK